MVICVPVSYLPLPYAGSTRQATGRPAEKASDTHLVGRRQSLKSMCKIGELMVTRGVLTKEGNP